MWRRLAGMAACLALIGGCESTGGNGAPDGGQAGAAAGTSGAAGGAGSGNHMTQDGLMDMGGVGVVGAGMLGDWVYAAGTTTRTCPGESPSVAAPEGGLNVAAGSAGELVVTEACPLRFKLAGSVATIVPGQSCAGSDGAGGQIAFTMVTWTLTLSRDGQTVAESLAADEKLTPAGGA